MKTVFLFLALSTAAFGASYRQNLYPQRGHIQMYNCEPGVKADFAQWTDDKATIRLSNFKLGFSSCGHVDADPRVYVLTLKSKRAGQIWTGVAQGGRTVRVYDYRNGAGPSARPEAPFLVEEYDAAGRLIQRLYPPTGSRG
jgi:hypothetical protein